MAVEVKGAAFALARKINDQLFRALEEVVADNPGAVESNEVVAELMRAALVRRLGSKDYFSAAPSVIVMPARSDRGSGKKRPRAGLIWVPSRPDVAMAALEAIVAGRGVVEVPDFKAGGARFLRKFMARTVVKEIGASLPAVGHGALSKSVPLAFYEVGHELVRRGAGSAELQSAAETAWIGEESRGVGIAFSDEEEVKEAARSVMARLAAQIPTAPADPPTARVLAGSSPSDLGSEM